MNYLTNYYKNLCEQLQAKVNNLENILNEAFVRNPTDQFHAGFHSDKPAGWQNRRADQQPTNSYVARYEAGLHRMHDMIHYQAAHAISEPHEQEAIEAVLTDMANSGTGTAANMGHMRTAIGAVKRLKGTQAFAKSLSSVRAPIERAAMDQAGQMINQAQEDIFVDSDTLRNTFTDEYAAEQYDDAFHDVAQQHILGPRKKVDPRTAAIRQQPQVKRNSPDANPGRIM